jgi:hypothetical protein
VQLNPHDQFSGLRAPRFSFAAAKAKTILLIYDFLIREHSPLAVIGFESLFPKELVPASTHDDSPQGQVGAPYPPTTTDWSMIRARASPHSRGLPPNASGLRVVMDVILILLTASAIVGLVLGFYFSWIAIVASGLVLAIVSAAVLQAQGFGFFVGISIVVACLTVNQLAYLIGVRLKTRGSRDR